MGLSLMLHEESLSHTMQMINHASVPIISNNDTRYGYRVQLCMEDLINTPV